MNVLKEKKDDLNAILRVVVEPTDYLEKVEKSLNDYRKQASIPGFRPGKAPAGMIRKKYYKSVLVDELNRAVQHSLTDFLRTSDLQILGQPLPSESEKMKGDFDQPEKFEFSFDVGICPPFEVGLSANDQFDYLKLAVTDEMVQEELDGLQRRFGSLVPAEVIGEKHMVFGEFVELENGEPKENGIKHSSTISIEFLTDDAAKKILIGKTKDDKIELDPRSVSRGDTDLAAMLGIEKNKLSEVGNSFHFIPQEIREMNLAEMNTEFFNKVYKDGAVASVDELKQRIREDISRMYEADADRHLSNKVTENIMKKTAITLPEDFLRRWIRATTEDEKTVTEMESNFATYMEGLKWQLIQNKLIRDNNISITAEEMKDYAKGMIVRQYSQYGMPAPSPELLEEHANKILAGDKEGSQIRDNILGVKLLGYFKQLVKLNTKELPLDQFTNEAVSGMRQPE